jgi:uncharacterized protein (TIGR03118 family)
VAALIAAAAPSARAQGYGQSNIVSDIPGLAAHTDPNLINAWGIYVKRNGSVVVNAADAGVSTAYQPNGTPLPLVVSVPGPGGAAGAPTGIAFNPTGEFKITAHGRTAPSRFIYVTEDGTIAGWNPAVDVTHAILALDNSGLEASYKGVAIAVAGGHAYLYVADFHNSQVSIYDGNFHFVRSFTDQTLADNSFGPFNVANIGGKIYVAFAMQDAEKDEEVAGAGFGYVDVFNAQGHFIRRFASEGALNAPWAIVRAPGNFGEFSGALLVGNFGDGWVNAFNPNTGAPLGHLSTPGGQPIAIDGLWGLAFHGSTLWFAAGPNLEEDGLVGTLTPAAP